MPVAPGTLAPSAEARTLDGDALDLEALAALGPALLFFYRTDCPASVAAAHALPRVASVPGVTVAAVSQDREAEARAFAVEHGLEPGRVLTVVDPEPWQASSAYGVLVTPTWILLAPGGRVEAIAEGWSRDDASALAAKAAALAGAPAPVVSTAADGPAFRPG